MLDCGEEGFSPDNRGEGLQPTMEKPLLHFDSVIRKRPDFFVPIQRALRGQMGEIQDLLSYLQQDFPAIHAFVLSSLAYAAEGQQVFVAGPRLQQMLMDTDCREVPRQFLKSPFKCFYLALPDSMLEIFGDQKTRMHRVAGCYVFEPEPDIFIVCAWGKPNERSVSFDDDATFWFRLNLREIPTKDRNGLNLLDFEEHCEFLIKTGKEASDSLVNLPPEDKELAVQTLPRIARMVVNFLLYLSSQEVELVTESQKAEIQALSADTVAKLGQLKSTGKQKKLLRRFQRLTAALSAATLTWIGRSYEETETNTKPSTDSSRNWSVRRGHFHHYWTGKRTREDGTRQPGESLVLKWVAPVYRSGKPLSDTHHEYRFRVDERP